MTWQVEASLFSDNIRHRLATLMGGMINDAATEDDRNLMIALVQLIRKGFLSGSAISSIYHNEEVNDYDIYFDDYDTLVYIKNTFMTKKNYQALVKSWTAYEDDTEIPLIEGISITGRAITLENKFQLITMGNLSTCRPTFDFIHCTPYYDFSTEKLHISERQLFCIKNKLLSKNPTAMRSPAKSRIEKFKKRGWKLSSDLTKTAELV